MNLSISSVKSLVLDSLLKSIALEKDMLQHGI
jgi:hypothetical protein